MTVAVEIVDRQDIGNAERIIADVTFDSVYARGGEPVTAKELGFRVGAQLFRVFGRFGKYEVVSADEPALSSRASRDQVKHLVVRETIPPSQDFLMNAPLLSEGTGSKKEVKVALALFMGNGATPVEDAEAEHAFIAADADTPQERWYSYSSVDGATVVVTPGTIAAEGAAVPPANPANAAPYGLVRIVVAAGAVPFNATTDDLDAAHLTVTYFGLDGEVYQGTDLSALVVRVVAEGR